MTLNYKRIGQGQPVVLLHGLFGSLDNLGVISRALRHQFDVLSIDLPDHGQSSHSNRFNYDDYAQQVIKTINHNDIQSPAILGHSMGGKVAMHIALHYPDAISKLIVADIAPVRYSPRHSNVFKALQSVNLNSISSRKDAEQMMAQHIEEQGVIQFLIRSLAKTESGGFTWRFNLDLLLRDYDDISMEVTHTLPFNKPTLFIKGGNSNYITQEHRPIIHQLFPRATAKIMQGVGHWLHAEKPAVFAKLVADFITIN